MNLPRVARGRGSFEFGCAHKLSFLPINANNAQISAAIIQLRLPKKDTYANGGLAIRYRHYRIVPSPPQQLKIQPFTHIYPLTPQIWIPHNGRLQPALFSNWLTMAIQVRKLGKRIINYPEERIPVISARDWVRNLYHDPLQNIISYLTSLFPILGWMLRYNLGWASGDIIAGITVGIVLVPQSMSYAQIATLPPEYGLYSSFVGVLVYCFFATSKDVSIGPVAVMSLTVSQIIKHVNNSHPNVWEGPQIATTVAFICGFIVLGIGLLRLGWLVEFIPAPAVNPGLMGISGFDTRAATYKVFIDTLKGLPGTQLDAAFGLTGLASLYLIRIGVILCPEIPSKARFFFFMSVFRNAFIIVVLTFASWLYCRHRKDSHGKYPIKILQDVPRGFKHLGQPNIDPDLVKALAGELPVATIILFLEHIAISKSFGRVNGYKINPNQELIAIGVTNTIGTLFGAYPATGSFSRSALQSKSGVRSPAAGLFSAVVVIVALYGLTPAFFWIPTAALSAVIIHAVADLVAAPAQVYSYWRVSPVEFVIWFAAVLVTVFATIEDGIYTSIAASLVLLLVRVARPRGNFLGKVTVRGDSTSREVFVPLKPNGNVMNPHVKVYPPSPGVLVYRFEESLLYPNSSLANDAIVDYVKENTRRGKDMSNIRSGDRPWNDPGGKSEVDNATKPLLHAVVLDFSAVSHIDTTGIQALIDTRTEVERWADRPIEFHFAMILSPWIRRSLVAGGFGSGVASSSPHHEVAPVTRYHDEYISDPQHSSVDPEQVQGYREEDPEAIIVNVGSKSASSRPSSDYTHGSKVDDDAPIVPSATPFFHFDLAAAVRAAETGLVSRGRL
ncbi:putative sulfate permease C3H7.02 [Grifola frondosa]|uniref:Putative sulfate permease C3H7.02 n=1 Tax=Grifola frondosa TaxID=5627 RepID=A0A1C7MGL8_GRIFR|nr:putative sulfate permease C3H7.02 [Grifola frondosa]